LKFSRNVIGVAQIFGAALLWGTAGTFSKYLFNNDITPFDLAQMRITLSFMLLLVFFAVHDGLRALKVKTERQRAGVLGGERARLQGAGETGQGEKGAGILRIRRRDIPYFLIFGLVGMMFNQFAYLFTISQTNVATAVFLQYMAPALILVYGLITRTEKLSVMKLAALAASLCGGYLIVVGTASGLGLSPLGLASGVAAAFAFAFYSIYGKYGLNNYNSWTILTWGFGVGAIAWLLYQPPWEILARYPDAWPHFLYIAVFATILPFGLYLKGLGNLTAFKAGLIGTLEPVIGAISAFLFLKEVLNVTQIAGCALILLGVILIQVARDPKSGEVVRSLPENV